MTPVNEHPELWVSQEELEARYAKVRAFLGDRGLAALVVYSPAAEHKWGQTGHVSYLTGWANHDRIVDSVVVVPMEGPPALLFAGLPFMLEGIEDVSPVGDVRLVQAVDPNAVAMDRGAASGPRSFAGGDPGHPGGEGGVWEGRRRGRGPRTCPCRSTRRCRRRSGTTLCGPTTSSPSFGP